MPTKGQHRASDHSVLALEPRRLLAGFGLDRFFGTDGVGFTDVNQLDTTTRSSFVEPATDGGFFVVGKAAPLLAKLKRDGSPDPAYGQAGIIRLNQLAKIDPVKLMPLPDGSVIIGANVTVPSDRIVVFLKFTPQGQIDQSYGVGGIATLNVGVGNAVKLLDAVVLADGSVIGVGNNNLALRDRGLMMRFDPNGSSSGPVSGYDIVEFADETGYPMSGSFSKVIALSDGGYLIAGGASVGPTSFHTYRRFDALGEPVLSFGVNGIRNTTAMPAGQMLEIGSDRILNRIHNRLYRFSLATGEIDTAYGARTLVLDPVQGSEGAPINAALTRQGNLALVYKSVTGLTAALYDLNGNPVTVAKSTPSNSTSGITFNSNPEPGAALLAGDQLIAIYGDVTGLIQGVNKPLVYARFNVFENQPQLLDDGIDAYHLRAGEGNTDIRLRIDGTELVATLDGVEHRVALSARKRLLIADAGGTDTVTIGDCTGLDIDLDVDVGNDVIRLDTTTRATSVRILGGEGNDLLEMRLPPSGAAVDIGTLSFNGEAGIDALVVLGSDGDDVIRLLNSFESTSSVRAALPNLERISIQSGTGNDLVSLGEVQRAIALVVNGGEGNDTIESTIPPNGFSNNVESSLFGDAGEDRFVFRPWEWKYFVDGGDDADAVEFLGDASNDSLTVSGDDLQFFFSLGAGNSMVRTAIREAVTFTAGGGTDRLAINDSARSVAANYVVTSGVVFRDGTQVLSASGVDELVVNGGTADDRFDATGLFGPMRVTLTGGTGNDSLQIDESADTADRVYTIGSFLVRDGQSRVVGFENVTLRAGNGKDTVSIVPSATTRWTFDGGAPSAAPGDELKIRTAGVAGSTIVEDSPGNGRVTFTSRLPVEYRNVETVTLMPPAILSGSFPPGSQLVALTLETTLQIYNTLPVAQTVEVVNLTTGQTIPTSQITINGSSTTLRVNLRQTASPRLADGNYRLTVHSSQLKDAVGNVFGPDFVYDFFILSGDANGDRAVDFSDLLIVSQNWGRQFSQGLNAYTSGDFSGNGRVDFDDLLILAQHYGAVLTPAPARSALLASKSRRQTDVLSDLS